MQLEPLPTELRPTPALMKYYALSSLLAGPAFIFPLLATYARYRSLRYRIDDEGISMRWGILFRREVSLAYARVQDIHLSSNVLERWLGLGKIQVQTASGSSKAEMTIEGVPDLERMRDFLYQRMRGARGEAEGRTGAPAAGGAAPLALDRRASRGLTSGDTDTATDELTRTLEAVAAELRALREQLAVSRGGGRDAARDAERA